MILKYALAFAALLMPLVAADAAPAKPGCRPITGLEALLERPSLRWIVVGEQHGTNEMPAAFLDIVCNAAASKRPVVVAIEHSETQQPDLDAFLKSDGGEAAQRTLVRGDIWTQTMQDGRGSRAYLTLIDGLRRMKQAGSIDAVVAFVPDAGGAKPGPSFFAEYERLMADRLMKASAGKDTLVLAFAGNCHAMRRQMCGNKPAAAYLPSDQTFTINLEGSGGTAWTCSGVCGPRKVGGASPVGQPRLEMLNDPKVPWDSMLFLGGPVSASPPAVAQAEATPRS